MKHLKVKIIGGFRKDQHYTIDGDEAHKAYHLFLNPDRRAIFKNGLAIIGADVRGIEPDYNATMGWNADHVLGGEDWNEIRVKGINKELRDVLTLAKEVAINFPEKVNLPLSEVKPLK
jgi:hypothetical protein